MRKTLLLAVCILLFTQFCSAQSKQISGKITNVKDGSSVAGATVTAKQSKASVISGNDGSFTIPVLDKEKELTITYVGFADITVPINSSYLLVQLTESAQSLSEVVVVGYGTAVKKNLTGNVAIVKGSDVQNMPVPNFNQALQGRAAGVFIEGQSGKVGEAIKIRIRGSGSITAGNEPLYVVDGLPINTGSASGDPLADINFNDIESFNILKDAAATAIYGSRGANGVVIINTKKGRSGKTNLQVNLQGGTNKPTHLRGFLNAPEYVSLIREAAINSDMVFDNVDPTDAANYSGSYLEYAENTLDGISGYSNWRDGKINTNWEKLAFNDNATTSSADVSASGGNEKTKFYLSGSYTNQDGILIANSFKRLSGRMNIDHTVSDKIKIGANLTLSQTTTNRVSGDNDFSSPMEIVALSPVTPVRDTAGNLYNVPVTTYYNPLVDAEFGHWRSQTYRNIGNVYIQWKILNSLSFRTEFGADIQNQNDDKFYGAQTTNGLGINGYGESDWYKSLDYNSNNYFTFDQTFGNHHINAVVGYAYQNYHYDYANVYGQDFPVQDLQKLASAGKITGGTSYSEDYRLISYFARVDYSFASKYLIGLSGRIDGSSRFGANHKNGSFPAVSAGWVISDENFLKNSKALSFLKLRGSWGLSGNDQGFGDYASLTQWGGVSYAGASGLSPTQLGNDNLQWEKSNQADIGLEYGFLNNRLSGEIDLYDKKTNHLLYSVPVPGNSGFTSQLVNIGSMQNKGIEFVLNTQNVSLKDFKWSTSINIAYNKNKITKLDGGQTIIPGNDGRFLNSLLVGQGIGVFYGPKFAGADPQTGDALYYKEDGKSTTNDYNAAGNFVVGDPNPDWIGGVTNTFSFKGIDLSILFQGVFGNQINNGAGGFMSSSFDYFDNQTRETLNRWQKPGDITDVPQLRLLGGNGTGASSRYVYNGDYVRLKNLTLSYSLPAALLKKWSFQSLRVYVTGVNLITWTKYLGWDPEVNTDYRAGNRNQGGDFYAAPQIKNYSVGLNLGF